VDSQCDKMVTIVSHQFITLAIHFRVPADNRGCDAPCHASLSVAIETHFSSKTLLQVPVSGLVFVHYGFVVVILCSCIVLD